MIQTNLARSDMMDDDSLSHASSDLHTNEHFTCTRHPTYKLEVLCTKDNFYPPLLCIKCLLEPEVNSQVKGEHLVPIKDIIIKAAASELSPPSTSAAKETLNQKFLEFTGRDYFGIYARHAGGQMKKLDREINRIKDGLEDLRYQFQNYFDKQTAQLQLKEEVLRNRVTEYLDESTEADNMRFLSLDEILDEIPKISEAREYEKFIKVLYHRGHQSQDYMGNAAVSDILETMENFKDQVAMMKNSKVDTYRLEEIRQNLDSMDMLDRCLQAFPCSLNPRLEQTIEKVRKGQQKRLENEVKQRNDSDPGYHSADKHMQRRPHFLESLRGKLVNSEKKPLSTTTELEIEYEEPAVSYHRSPIQKVQQGPHYHHQQHSKQSQSTRSSTQDQMQVEESRPSHQKMSQRSTQRAEFEYQSPHFAQSQPLLGDTISNDPAPLANSSTQTQQMQNAGTSTSHGDEYHAKQSKKATTSKKKASQTTAKQEQRVNEPETMNTIIEEDHYPHSAQFPDDGEFTFNKSPEPKEKSKPSKSATQSLAKSQQSSSKLEKTEQKKRQSSNVGNKDRAHAQYHQQYRHQHSSLDQWIRTEKDPKKSSVVQSIGEEPFIDTTDKVSIGHQHGERSDEGHSGTLTPKKAADRSIQGLHDWINRRVTGYLVFQNTMQDDKSMEKDKEGGHLNRLTGQKWRKLAKMEKEEYKSIAMNARVDLKKEFKDVDKDSPELKELQELVDQKLKTIKKEL